MAQWSGPVCGPMQSLGVFSAFSVLSVHVFSVFNVLSVHCLQSQISSIAFSRCALRVMFKWQGSEPLGGGYKQRERTQKLRKRGQLKQSHVAQYLVLRPAPLPIPPPIKLCLY